MSSKPILSFFKKPVNTVNNGADAVINTPESSWTVVNSDLNSENVFVCFKLLFITRKRFNIHRKILCFQKLSLDLGIVSVNITGLLTVYGCIIKLRKIMYFAFVA